MKTLLIMLLLLSTSFAQAKKPQPSPRGTVSQVIGLTKVTIDYGRPAAKGRDIFGGIEKFDKVWRIGANEATEIEFAGDVMIAGKKVSKGRYTLFAIPKKGAMWTVIINKELKQWGAFKHNPDNDLMRFDVKVMSHSNTERLSFSFENFDMKSGDLVFAWVDKTFSIKISE